MNIIEEQNMTDEPNPDVTGNMDVPADVPSAKKVYSKPTLVVLTHINNSRSGKTHHHPSEDIRPQGTSVGTAS